MATLERAIAIAAAAHAGQVDKAGQPYILHPLRVMLRMTTVAERIVAVLHDVVEDTEVTLEVLGAEGFLPEVISAVDALTKRQGESRVDVAYRAKQDSIACLVKLADNAENMDLSRIAEPTERDFARLEEYKMVRSILHYNRHTWSALSGAVFVRRDRDQLPHFRGKVRHLCVLRHVGDDFRAIPGGRTGRADTLLSSKAHELLGPFWAGRADHACRIHRIRAGCQGHPLASGVMSGSGPKRILSIRRKVGVAPMQNLCVMLC